MPFPKRYYIHRIDPRYDWPGNQTFGRSDNYFYARRRCRELAATELLPVMFRVVDSQADRCVRFIAYQLSAGNLVEIERKHEN